MRRRTFLVSAAALLAAGDALARPAGGQGYSGSSGGSKSGGSSGSRSNSGSGNSGSRSSGSGKSGSSGTSGGGSGGGGGDGGGAALGLLIHLVFTTPQIGIPLLVLIGVVFVAAKWWGVIADWRMERARMKLEEISDEEEESMAEGRLGLVRIVDIDPSFSPIVFEDFLHHLYTRVHEARGANKLDDLSPYVTRGARAALEQEASVPIEGVIVGSTRVLSVVGVGQYDPQTVVTVRFEANYTELTPSGRQAKWVEETWTFARRRGAQSHPPERVRMLGCPSCGAPLKDARDNRCRSCKEIIVPGEFDWALTTVYLEAERTVPPALTTHVEERGQDKPTIVAHGARKRLEKLGHDDATFSFGALSDKVREIHRVMGAAWSELAWERARPYLSDGLFQSQRYWIDAYRAAGLRNITKDTSVLDIKLSDCRTDPYYDAVVVRIYAKGLDYTVEAASQKVVSGSDDKPRPYSEYWTLIRARSVAGPPPEAPAQCPNCGAALVDGSGAATGVQALGGGHGAECRYCKAQLVRGDFDWILARIEQDDGYQV